MALKTLLVQNLRIIQQLEISLATDANLFVGENGAGKTSILEAIDILSRGRSFRERRTQALLRKNSSDLVISGALIPTGKKIHLGIQKSAKQTNLHMNQEKVNSISTHASYLPVVSLHPDSHRLIQGGGKYRRKYLDWSAFHVEPSFLNYWRNYSKCLKQRNQALRDQCTTEDLSAWTTELSDYANLVDRVRSDLFEKINPIIGEYSRKLLPELEVNTAYYRGWPEGLTLAEALGEVITQERHLKTTRLGPHRADLKVFLNEQDAAAAASRGQEKLLAACLLLAQIKHIQQTGSLKCVVLLDDVRAELDSEHADALLTALQNLGCQVFITAIEQEQIDLSGWKDTQVFHVKHGVCKAMK